jgi:hypothetical protein
MVSLLQALWRAWHKPTPKLVCPAKTWTTGVAELNRRTRGEIEAGAFLLGRIENGIRQIEKFVFYDDIDPTCFANRYGIVEFDGRNFGKLWGLCRDLGMTVVADVHVHPGHFGQSLSDKENPMIPQAGHIALILPNYAAQQPRPGQIGIFEYCGNRQWSDYSPRGKQVFHIGWWP